MSQTWTYKHCIRDRQQSWLRGNSEQVNYACVGVTACHRPTRCTSCAKCSRMYGRLLTRTWLRRLASVNRHPSSSAIPRPKQVFSKWCHFRTISRFTRCNTSLFYNISCVLYSVYLIIYLPYAPFVYFVLTCIPLNIYTIWFVFNINLTWPLTMGHCRMYSVRVNMRRCACAEDHTVRSACAPDNY